ncbi:hypothetical protein ABGN05_04180 [Aquibium sp. LZ166]|uniref:Uncharacterized protein n=1 Tax=Aquibium pacificus TaxID=3153579 RepID=A0ABV3SEY0_9HYPH
MTRLIALLAALLPLASVSSPVLAQTLDLGGPYGNETGCRAAGGEEEPGEDALVLRPDRIETRELICSFVQVLTAGDGTKVVTALCDIEGEEGRSVNLFSIAASGTDPASLVIRDEYGAAWDEVKPCS